MAAAAALTRGVVRNTCPLDPPPQAESLPVRLPASQPRDSVPATAAPLQFDPGGGEDR